MDEKPKAVLKKNHFSAFIQCLIHVPPVAITIGVLSLNFRSVFWTAPGPNTNSVLDAMQFAAKVHESLAVVSLFHVVIYYLRRDLLGSRGVPLGLLSSGFQLTSAAYMFSAEFWGGVCSKGQRAVRRAPLVLIILVAFTLANLAGPSSAVAMIPRLDWWPVGELRSGNGLVFSAYIQARNDTLFPETVTKDTVPHYCFGGVATSQNDCPSSGLQAIIANAEFLSNTDASFWSSPISSTINITMPLPKIPAGRFLSLPYSLLNGIVGYAFPASSIPDFLGSIAWEFYAILTDGGPIDENEWSTLSFIVRPLVQISIEAMGQRIKPHKPVVQVQCDAIPFNISDIIFPHTDLILSPWSDEAFQNAEWSIPSAEISGIAANHESGKVNFTWVALESDKIPKPSLAGIFIVPRPADTEAIYACTVGANWVPTEPWIDPANDIFIHETLPGSPGDSAFSAFSYDSTSISYPPLYIQLAWADSLNVMYHAADLNQTAMEAIASACLTSTGSGTGQATTEPRILMSECLQMGLALYITDGLARLQSAIPAYLAATTPGQTEGVYPRDFNLTDLNSAVSGFSKMAPNISLGELGDTGQFTKLHFEVLQYGYGYGLRGIVTYLAVAVLLIHVTLAIIHMGILLAEGLTIRPWSSMGEMMVLSFNSSSAEQLRNTGAGISRKATWGLVTKVRETSDSRLQLVLEENDDQAGRLLLEKQVKPGKKYG